MSFLLPTVKKNKRDLLNLSSIILAQLSDLTKLKVFVLFVRGLAELKSSFPLEVRL